MNYLVRDQIYLQIAKKVAELSDISAPHRHTSAVFVNVYGSIIASGSNGTLHNDGGQFTEHAERAAIYDACLRGVSLAGSTVYLPWFPCVECARALAMVGVYRMVGVEPDWTEEKYKFRDAEKVLIDNGVKISFQEIS